MAAVVPMVMGGDGRQQRHQSGDTAAHPGPVTSSALITGVSGRFTGNTFTGGSGAGLELGASPPFVQAYDRTAGGFAALAIYALSINFQPQGGSVVSYAQLIPGSDNGYQLGNPSYRWSTVYASTGSINTSDETLKAFRAGGISDAELAWAQAIALMISAYQFKDAIADKGADRARMHWGVGARAVHAAGILAGIADPFHYAFLCRDPLKTVAKQDVTITRQASESVIEQQLIHEVVDGRVIQRLKPVRIDRALFDDLPVVDEAGNPLATAEGAPVTMLVPRTEQAVVQQDVEVPVLDSDGNPVMRWGVRYDELAMFLEAARSAALQPSSLHRALSSC